MHTIMYMCKCEYFHAKLFTEHLWCFQKYHFTHTGDKHSSRLRRWCWLMSYQGEIEVKSFSQYTSLKARQLKPSSPFTFPLSHAVSFQRQVGDPPFKI